MSKKKIGLLVVGAGIIVGAVMSGGTDPATTTAAVEPSTPPIATQVPTSPSRSVVPSVTPSPSPTPSAPTGIVTEVVDGDTIRVELPTGAETVRIIGIDTPEVVHPSQPEACFGAEATAYAKKALDGETVTLETDPTQDERDRYDRLLAHVYVGDELYAASAIAGGYGIHYIYEAPSSHADELDAAAAAAKADGRGIWASCDGRVDLPKVAPVPAATPAATGRRSRPRLPRHRLPGRRGRSRRVPPRWQRQRRSRLRELLIARRPGRGGSAMHIGRITYPIAVTGRGGAYRSMRR
jgi:micrococcal nuclease